jgi:hypothetical protein
MLLVPSLPDRGPLARGQISCFANSFKTCSDAFRDDGPRPRQSPVLPALAVFHRLQHRADDAFLF